jgi:hypothetical protein
MIREPVAFSSIPLPSGRREKREIRKRRKKKEKK